jgi:hypothetical protein
VIDLVATATQMDFVMTASAPRPLSFERLLNRIKGNSATFVMYRAAVPGGWIVAMRPNDTMTFVPDPDHEWDGGSVA